MIKASRYEVSVTERDWTTNSRIYDTELEARLDTFASARREGVRKVVCIAHVDNPHTPSNPKIVDRTLESDLKEDR